MATIGTTSRPAYVYDQETDTWVPVGVGPHTHENFITSTTIDAKGDLLAGSAPDTVERLPIGANGTMLVADATQTLGMAWSNTITIASGTTVPLTIQNNGTGNSFVVNDEVSDTTPFIITAGGSVGIGTTTPDTIFNISSAATQVFIDRYSTDNGAPEIVTRKARGTESSPSAVQSGDVLLWLGARGFGTTAFPSISNSTILMIAGENFTDSARGSFITFNNTAIGTNTRTEHMRITSAGNVGIGTTTPAAKLDVNGSIKSDNLSSVNVILNSSFNVWQRGTSFAYVGGQQYTTDRWMLMSGNTGRTVSRQLSGLTGFQYAARVQKDSGSLANASIRFGQTLETVNSFPFAGQTVTFSFYARIGANFSATSNLLTVKLFTGTGTDQNFDAVYTGSATPINTTVTATTSWQRFTATANLATNVTEMGIEIGYTPVGTAGANDWFEITGVQVELGNVATPYRSNQPTYQAELAACQRYYWRTQNVGSGGAFFSGAFGARGPNGVDVVIFNPVPMRTGATSMDINAMNMVDSANPQISGATFTLDGVANSTNLSSSINVSKAASFEIYRPYWMRGTGASSYIGFSAEL
jgi:hypothetical protein